jgi:predicted porin
MKILAKSALALAIAATTSVPTFAAMGDAPDVTGVTGRFRTLVLCNDDTCNETNIAGRFRMAAEQDMGNGNSVFGKFELQPTTRLSYVGVKGDFGSLSLGTRWSPFYNVVVSPVDWSKAFGGTWNSPGTGYSSNFRVSDAVFFSTGGLQTMIQMTGDDANEDIDQIEVGYSMALGAATVGIALNDSETAADTRVGISAAGNAGSVRLAASYYDQGANSGLLAQVMAPMGGGTVSLSLGQNMRDAGAEASMVAVEFDKPLGASSSWFVGVEQNDDDAGSDTTVYGAGLHYNFN